MNRGVRNKDLNSTSLKDLREQIDSLDKELVSLLDQRAELVYKVGEFKKSRGLQVFDPSREKEVLDKVIQVNRSHLSDVDIQSMYAKLIEQFRLIEGARLQIESADLPQYCEVGFFGFGLISASVALALSAFRPRWKFLIFDPYIEVDEFQKWKIKKNAHQFDLVNQQQLRGLDFVFLGAPVEVNKKVAQQLAHFNKCVLDLGSVQSNIDGVYGFHPLAGKEVSKYPAAQADLFYNKIICLTNIENLDSHTLHLVEMLAHALGANTYKVSAMEHNKALAFSSHLLQLLSIAFGLCLEEQGLDRKTDLVPNSARELLRLSGSNRVMWKSIVEENQKEIVAAIDLFQSKLAMIKTSIENGEKESISDLFSKSLKIYEDLYMKRKAS